MSHREIMVERQGRGGRYLRTDVSVPISKLADFVSDSLAALERARPDALAVTYGHVGDGNIHLRFKVQGSGFTVQIFISRAVWHEQPRSACTHPP